MQTYSLLREFADSWMLLALFVVFVCAVIWAFRPGSARTHNDAAASIFRNEKRPAPEPAPEPAPKSAPKSAPEPAPEKETPVNGR